MDGRTRITIFNSSYMTLPSNPDAIMYNQFYLEYTAGSDRTEIIHFSNNYIENIVDNIYAVLDTYLQPNTQLFIDSNYFVSVSGLFGSLQMSDSGYATVTNNTYINSTNFGFAIIELNNVDGALIDGFYIDNVITTGDNSQNLIYALLRETSELTLNNIIISNSKVNSQKMIFCNTFILNFILTNSIFKNITVTSGVSLINVDSSTIFKFDNVTFSEVHGNSSNSISSYWVLLTNFDLSGNRNSTITNIKISNSLIGFLFFNSISNSPPDTRLLLIKNVEYLNWNFLSKYDLIVFGGIVTSENFQIQLSNISFQNMSFYFGGNLIYFESQMVNQIVMSDSYATNVTGGSILIEAFNKNNLVLPASVRLINFTTNEINALYSSFILINEGGYLDILNSNFQNVMSYESGSVISAGYQKSTTNIYNSTFKYNSAINAGVFSIQSESVVKIFNSKIYSNFAKFGGVLIASTNGYFELYNTTIYQNYALSVSTIEIFDVATLPIISACNINNNTIMTMNELISEINNNWSKLWFLQGNFKRMIISMESTLSLIISNYWVQLISGSLSLQDNTIIENQGLVIQSFSSILNVQNTVFQNISVTDSSIVIINSNSTIKNSSASLIVKNVQNSNSFLSISFGSIITLSNFTYKSSTSSFITIDSSTLNADQLGISNVSWYYYFMSSSQR